MPCQLRNLSENQPACKNLQKQAKKRILTMEMTKNLLAQYRAWKAEHQFHFNRLVMTTSGSFTEVQTITSDYPSGIFYRSDVLHGKPIQLNCICVSSRSSRRFNQSTPFFTYLPLRCESVLRRHPVSHDGVQECFTLSRVETKHLKQAGTHHHHHYSACTMSVRSSACYQQSPQRLIQGQL